MRSNRAPRPAPPVSSGSPARTIGLWLFKLRGYTPIPLVLVALIGAQPTRRSFLGGTLLVAAGEALRVWGVSHAGSATRTREVGAPRLVTSGPYARTRNPLYVGNLLMTAGIVVLAHAWMPWMLLIVFAAFVVQYSFIVRVEETRLRELFGALYEDYCAHVPRFGVRLHPWPDAEQHRGDVAMAWRSETRTFQTTALLFLLFAARAWWAHR